MLTGKFGRDFRNSVCRDGPFGRRQYTIIYAIDAPEFSRIKFGRTTDIDRRFRQICNGAPCELKLRGHLWMPDETEVTIFGFLAEDRCHGEWFHSTERSRSIAALIGAKRDIDLAHALGMTHMLAEHMPSGVSWGAR